MSKVVSHIDDITGLYGLDYFKRNYNDFITKNPDAKIIAIDFSKLKYINDTFGHPAGDICLKSFGKYVTQIFTDSVFVRRSGDEFLILTAKANEEIELLLQKVIDTINKNYILGELPFNYGFNSGITTAEHGIEISLDKADAVLMDAKKKGLLFEYYSKDIYEKIRGSEIFIKEVKKNISDEVIHYAEREVYDVNHKQANIVDVYSRDQNDKTFLSTPQLELLRGNYVLSKLDFLNLRKIILDSSSVKNGKLMINIHNQTLFSKEEDFEKFIMTLCEIADNNASSYVLCLNIDSLGSEWTSAIPKIELLKKLGFGICIASLNVSITNPALNIWTDTDIDYMKISRESWATAMRNSKKEKLLESIISNFNETQTTPIFMRVDNEKELKYIRSMEKDGLSVGNAHDEEKKLELKTIKR